MAASKTCYRYLTPTASYHNPAMMKSDSLFEFNESDIWNSDRSSLPEIRQEARRKAPSLPLSVPVDVPDWSKILKGNYDNGRRWGGDGGDDDVYGVGASWVPPHEYLARKRIASLSVQEGIGRTLKGRDLRRVRNAIWEKTGFQD